MSYPHAAVWIDHHSAQIMQFDTDSVEAHTIRSHTHQTAQHGSTVRTEHEFFGEVCDALDGIQAMLITGSHTAIADFRHYADKHRAPTAGRIAGYEVVDHPSDKQLVALGRKFFVKPGQKAV
jgi:hypothetical protein